MRRLLAIAALTASLLLPATVDAVAPVEVAFSPNGGAIELVVRTIDSAKVSIRYAAYGFTSKPVATALLAAHRRGVDVRGVVDKSNATARYTAATFLANQGVPVRLDRQYAIMHDKFMVVDGATLETGSFNFTAAAESKNAENVLVLHDPAVAKRYAQGMGQAVGGVGGDEGAVLGALSEQRPYPLPLRDACPLALPWSPQCSGIGI